MFRDLLEEDPKSPEEDGDMEMEESGEEMEIEEIDVFEEEEEEEESESTIEEQEPEELNENYESIEEDVDQAPVMSRAAWGWGGHCSSWIISFDNSSPIPLIQISHYDVKKKYPPKEDVEAMLSSHLRNPESFPVEEMELIEILYPKVSTTLEKKRSKFGAWLRKSLTTIHFEDERAVEIAFDNKEFRLATIISQSMNSLGANQQQDIEFQIGLWKRQGKWSWYSPYYKKIYRLLSCDLSVVSSYDWLTRYGAEFWYGKSSKKSPELDFSDFWTYYMKQGDGINLLYQWFVMMYLESTSASNFFTNKNKIVDGLVLELDSLGMWYWGVYVIQQFYTANDKEEMLRKLLLSKWKESCSSDATVYDPEQEKMITIDSMLLDKLGISPELLFSVQSVYFKYWNKPVEEFQTLIKSRQYDQSHRLLVDHLMPQFILADLYPDLEEKLLVLEPMSNEISSWGENGQLLLEFIQVQKVQIFSMSHIDFDRFSHLQKQIPPLIRSFQKNLDRLELILDGFKKKNRMDMNFFRTHKVAVTFPKGKPGSMVLKRVNPVLWKRFAYSLIIQALHARL